MSRSPAGGTPQTVFIMMSFASDFDDVYATVKDSVAAVDESLEIIRLDEIRAAGSITDDMIAEIRKIYTVPSRCYECKSKRNVGSRVRDRPREAGCGDKPGDR